MTTHDTALDSNSHHRDRTGEKMAGRCHKLYSDSFFSSLKLVSELIKKILTVLEPLG
jgi:hypothetical protein